MRYKEFEKVMSTSRMSRYLLACDNDSRKAMTLYRLNLRLSQELFTVVSCFEVALRNAIDNHYILIHGQDWLRDATQAGGFFDNDQCKITAETVLDSYEKIRKPYSHPKLISILGFDFWRYMFGKHQYLAAGQNLIDIFPNKPKSTNQSSYTVKYVFKKLEKVNGFRNRIAHHEPVCFRPKRHVIDTAFATQHYQIILMLFRWLGVDESELLYGLDHVSQNIKKINQL